ncbi:MAG: hypothetical protein Q9160_000606 [Pyrenula sp. 1 TL-2023]
MARVTEPVQRHEALKQHQLLSNSYEETAITMVTRDDLKEDFNDTGTDSEDEPAEAPASKHDRRLAQSAVFNKLIAERAKDDLPFDARVASSEARDEVMTFAGGIHSAADMVRKGHAQKIIDNAREYQTELFERAKQTNTIAVLDTGSGKTLIAAMLIKHVLKQEYIDRDKGRPKRMIFFLVNTVTLVFQQHAMLSNNLDKDGIGRLCGAMGTDSWGREQWVNLFEKYTVIVCTAEVLHTAMFRTYVKLDDISLLILDECHHAKKNHPYALIMKKFYIPAKAGSIRPRIFGMTASPVDAKTDVVEASQSLEMDLNAKIATTTNLSLDQYVSRPNEEIWRYSKISSPSKSELFCDILKLSEVKELEEHKSFARCATLHLGRWCADHAWLLALSDREVMKIESRVEQRWAKSAHDVQAKDREIETVRQASALVHKWQFSNPSPTLQDLSPKVLLLYEKLAHHFNRQTDTQCIIFVQRRKAATILEKLFSQIGIKHLHSGILLGINSGDMSDMNSSFRTQTVTMDAFRRGQINCLFATSVAEEGIDIPGCNLVIRFDLYSNLIEYMQSRGRARRQNSTYAHMLEHRNLEHHTVYNEVREYEKKLVSFCKSLDKDRLLDFDAYSDHLDRLQHEASSRASATVKSGEITLDSERSLNILEQYTNSLRYENASTFRVLYIPRTEGTKFQYRVVLPEESPVQGTSGGLYARKLHAKQSAAFETCLLLRKNHLLDAEWRSKYRRRRPLMANARLAISSKKKDEYAMLVKPRCWELVSGQRPKQFHVMTMHINEAETSRPLLRTPAPLALVTRDPLPVMPKFPIYLEDDVECHVTFQLCDKPFSVTSKLLEGLTLFTLQIFLDVFNKDYEHDEDRMSYWLAPVKRRIGFPDQAWEIDTQTLTQILSMKPQRWETGQSADPWSNSFIVDPWSGKYRYFSKVATPSLGPWSAVPSEFPNRRLGMNSLVEYSCSIYGHSRSKVLENVDPSQPILAAELLETRLNVLKKRSFDEGKPSEIQICPQTLEISPLPIPVVIASRAFPAILSRIEAYLIAVDAMQSLALDIPAEWALEALTKDSDNTEEHHAEQIQVQRDMGKNYERLEFLGDAFLKMATSISLFVANPKNDEYDFHVQRMILICNQNLFDGAIDDAVQLTKYIRTRGFNRSHWYPQSLTMRKDGRKGRDPKVPSETRHSLGMKSVADVCEALIGAALLTARKYGQPGDLDLPVKAVSKFVHNENHNMLLWKEYSDRYELPAYQTQTSDGRERYLASKVSERLGYTFRYPRLLRSAMTHPSDTWESIPNYQRLEFLGDALFDMVAIEWLFDKFPDRDPQWLTEHKMAMVSNKFLAAVAVELGLDKQIASRSVAVESQIFSYSREVRAALEVGIENVESDYWTVFEHPPKCLSDIVEAYIGAIFIDSNFDLSVVEDFFRKEIKWHFENMSVYDTFANAHPTTFLYRRLTDDYGCMEYRLMSGEPYRDDGGVPKVLAALMVHTKVVTDAIASSGKTAKVRASEKALDILGTASLSDFRANRACSSYNKFQLTATMEILPPAPAAPTERPPASDPLIVLEHLLSVIQITLGAARKDLESVGSLLSKSRHSETLSRCSRFASEPHVALYAQKDLQDDDRTNGDSHLNSSRHPYTYTLSTEISYSSKTVASVAFLKRPSPIDTSSSLSSQIQVINLPGVASLQNATNGQANAFSPFEVLHSIVHLALSPYFEAYSRGQDTNRTKKPRNDADSRGIPGTKRKIAELELSLLHLQQNIEIPAVNLPLPDIVQTALEDADASSRQPSIELIPSGVIENSTVLNGIQNVVNGWIKSIQGITKIKRDGECDSAAQEINFWLSLETALGEIADQLQTSGVKLTIEILHQAKRHQAIYSFKEDTGLKEATELVQRYNTLMRDFPLDELLSATSLEKISDALRSIFAQMSRKLRNSGYPIDRSLHLVSAISGDLDAQMHALINGRSIMHLEYQDFKGLVDMAEEVWSTWEEHSKEFTNTARDITRRRSDRFIPIKINKRHLKTEERLRYVKTFRHNHEQLERTILNVLGSKSASVQGIKGIADEDPAMLMDIGDVDAIEEVSAAFAALKDVDVMDVSPEGTEAWVRAEVLYNERTSRVENSIIARLRDRLATARTANEMFRVFSKFNALLVRPKVRGAIAEYQTQLLGNVKEDIASLHDRFKQQYGNSEASTMAQLHDIPPVSGAIIWARQIEKQLDNYMRKVEAVLGRNWSLHTDGEKLQSESALFKKKLETRPIFESWVQDVSRRRSSVAGRLFAIQRLRTTGNLLEMSVNFDPKISALSKEVRNLTWLGFQVPHVINNIASESKRVYPFAISLMESVRIFGQTARLIAAMGNVALLLTGYMQEAQNMIKKGIPLRWESFIHSYELLTKSGTANTEAEETASTKRESRHAVYVREFASTVSSLQTKTATLGALAETIDKAVVELKTCHFKSESFRTLLNTVQQAVDKLNLENFANLQIWVSRLNSQIADILRERLEKSLRNWIRTFQESYTLEQSTVAAEGSLVRASSEEARSDSALHFPQVIHEITMRNQVLHLEPPLDYSRATYLEVLEKWLAVVCSLDQIKSSRYSLTIGNADRIRPTSTFASLPLRCSETLSAAYDAVDKLLISVADYVRNWLQFQSLWDLKSEQIQSALGDDLPSWLDLLSEIRKSRTTFDTSEVRKFYGNIIIDYEQVQTKVNAKYDQWQQEITLKFGSKLGGRIQEVFTDMSNARKDLEKQSLEASSTAHAVEFITIVQQCKRKSLSWEPEVETFRQGQTNLSRQRYHFPSDWLYVERVDGEWTAFSELLERKSKIVQEQTDALRAKIIAEDAVLYNKITEGISQWNEEKPVSGSVPPDHASALLTTYRSRFERLQTESELMAKAKEALDLPSSATEALGSVLEEVQDFTSVWAALSTIWQSINDLKETPWASIQPRKLRQSIDGLMKMTKEMPSRMRQYAAFEHVQNILRQHLKANSLLGDLKSDAVRDRHWTKIFKALRPGKRYSPSAMTLGDVWDLQLITSESIIRDVIVQARGELALEEFLKQVRDTWQNYSLELVNYHNKCRLIRGWDDLFMKCSENLNSLQAMRHSPYYKEFEEEASSWEDRLNRVHVLFDVWIDVQRQWVYLEGVFTGSADIKHLLPLESSRFQNINSEFSAVMKKVYKSPFVLDVLAISGVQKSLERLADLLNKIQKALGEYLERERLSFPRFYFVGDEDLLEIIGNSADTERVAKHFKKMFAGVCGLITDDNSCIVGITSKEGEEVHLRKEISLVRTPKINDWLAALEHSMKNTLGELLAEAIEQFETIFNSVDLDPTAFSDYLANYPAQVVVLATQVVWTTSTQRALENGGSNLKEILEAEVRLLELLATTVLSELDIITRRKCEHLITEFVHQRDVLSKLLQFNANMPTHYLWLLQMRYVYNNEGDFLQRLHVHMANARLDYGYEYLGVPDRLVRTPLTDRCFLTLSQALCQRLGGSPYGPAGTGKTESVKALGLQLGRFTLVFCCDDTFDFQAMGRIFLGICQVGAWGCFDEFNRLEERILSAVSQQIQNIQVGLRKGADDEKYQIELINRRFRVHSSTGIFITMNPGYAGRSNLPDNLKKLFRSVAMSKPDKELITEVMLFSQGFKQAKTLSKQTVPFFDHCLSRLTRQAHYDFGLRALKSVLVSSGGLKRARLGSDSEHENQIDSMEPQIIVQSIRETIAPKLVREDVQTLQQIQSEDFPGVQYVPADLEKLHTALRQIATDNHLDPTDLWITKAIQLYQIQQIHHGVMMVGGSGSGKSAIWKTLLQALNKVDGIEGVAHTIDSKVMSKEALYGSLDSTTREWSDGLFTGILRKIVDNLRGEDSKRHWIVFDGDVDPEWVENLNSVLDDNKLLTLPNGERLNLPPNVRIMFEVETLKYATLATVSRCGMVWFSEDTVTPELIISNYLESLRSQAFEDLDEDNVPSGQASERTLQTQQAFVACLEPLLKTDDFVLKALDTAQAHNHIMEFTQVRVLNSLFSLLSKGCRTVLEYNIQNSEFPLEVEQIQSYTSKKVLLAVVWAFTGDCPLTDRKKFGDFIGAMANVQLPALSDSTSMIDFDVSLPKADWIPWQSQVPSIELNTHSVTETDVVIPTIDTVRHEDVLYSWLAEHKPLLLCGPPGSGKTMTLFSALRKLPSLEVVGLNFSSATTPDLLIKTFEQYCEYRKTLSGVVMSPSQIGRWLVIFCDEINLPAPDAYGTQRAISFLRQLVEHNGFWRTSDKAWVSLDRIQFVGACNPPTDAGRHPLSPRFLRHAPLIMVDYPGELSLLQIYGTFNNAVLKVLPMLRGFADSLTKAMVQLYLESQQQFTPKIQPHYVYSPRELTRWVRGVYEAIRPLESLSVDGLIRIWAHEALRLFQDRLVSEDERKWTLSAIYRIALEHFPTINMDEALKGPILFSNWLSKNYISVEQEQLREFVKARLRTFCEEEVDVPLVLFNDVLEHALRIDRVFRQPQGHLILIGVSGSGKTTLSRFVAWMNGLKVFQIKVHGKYSAEDFDEDLRRVLRRCGCRGEKICFIMDESNVLDSGFLERMNTLLANGEVPGLFEGDDYASLLTACKEGAQRHGVLLDSQEELYKWFTQQIVRNLHVVFTMNPPEEGLSSKAATSPALFNRCVLNWMGDWSDQALYQVGSELTQSLDLDKADFKCPDEIPMAYQGLVPPVSHRDAVINTMVYVHHSMQRFNTQLEKQQNRMTYLTPRHYLDFVSQYVKLLNEKKDELEEQQRHLNVGLEKLRDTVDKVRDLKGSLATKKTQLEKKDAEANEKLQRMLSDQREAEKRKGASLEIQASLEVQEKEVSRRREIVLNDLAKAEPAVKEAQNSVSNIKRQHLTEVRSMGNPPSGVKLALESVCTLLGHRAENWKAIQGIVRRDDFIASIVNYDNERQMTPSLRVKMRNHYLSNEDFTFEKVNRASKACGPLVQWVEAQVNYSEILDRVGPLREEVDQLEEQALSTKAEAKAIENTIEELENSIATYKTEYAELISETQEIKTEMSRVQFKVDRSVRLLDSLSQERSRWDDGSKSFETQIQTLVGDVLIAAAFLAYGGFYDQQFRKAMVDEWLLHLSRSGIERKEHNPITEYLSSADERLEWQRHSLPVDDLCTENAIILKRFNRYPLIIDPSSRISHFLQEDSKDRRLTVTSFLDDTFVKQLESALRFGNSILIQDAEHMDPILNHVLNKEYQKTGGRVLIQLGKQEIDFSPAFRLYLSTRDPSANFPPDVCSRTTFANFTVTQSSLQTQSLNEVLKSERPDVDERRRNLAKMQGEFKTNLRQLEKRLLQALNESRGNILDDDTVIETLETLKKEAAVISKKMDETDGVMKEVEKIMFQYNVIAKACSATFAVLDQLSLLNHFYRFSLQFFLDIFNQVLQGGRQSSGSHDHAARADQILKHLFRETYRRTSLALFQKDKITLALLLAKASPSGVPELLFDEVLDTKHPGSDLSSEPARRDEVLSALGQMPRFKESFPNVSQENWTRFLTDEAAERCTPLLCPPTATALERRLVSVLVVKYCRMDRFVPAAELFLEAVFGSGFLDVSSDLKAIVDQVKATTPIALTSDPGFDASYKVDSLVERTHSSCANVAMGSNESLSSADKAISHAASTGSWVLVKNVHLTPQWLQSLEKRLGSLKPHADFRLFLSMETSLKIPVNVIRASRILMFEQPAGIRANMKDSLSFLAPRGSQAPVEKARVYLLLAFVHAVVQERLRYAPSLGWKALWEFNDSDYECCAFIIDSWMNNIAQGRSNVAPTKIPWDLIRALVTEMYGGKIDNESDFESLRSIVTSVLTSSAFDEDYALVPQNAEDPGLKVPNGTTMRDFTGWVDHLPEREPPTYLGLPANAEKVLLKGQAGDVIANVGRVTNVLAEMEEARGIGEEA